MKGSRDKTELADIILRYGDDYINHPSVLYHQQKVMRAIKNCRTSAMGGHKNGCDHCGHEDVSYNSCRQGVRGAAAPPIFTFCMLFKIKSRTTWE
jgi:hypothetical protein